MMSTEVDGCRDIDSTAEISSFPQAFNLGLMTEKSPDLELNDSAKETIYKDVRIIKSGPVISKLPVVEIKTYKNGSPQRTSIYGMISLGLMQMIDQLKSDHVEMINYSLQLI